MNAPRSDDPNAWTDEQLCEHIRAGGDPPEGDGVAALMAMLRDGAREER